MPPDFKGALHRSRMHHRWYGGDHQDVYAYRYLDRQSATVTEVLRTSPARTIPPVHVQACRQRSRSTVGLFQARHYRSLCRPAEERFTTIAKANIRYGFQADCIDLTRSARILRARLAILRRSRWQPLTICRLPGCIRCELLDATQTGDQRLVGGADRLSRQATLHP